MEEWGFIFPQKYYAVVKNICNARRYFEKYLKKFNIAPDLLLGICEQIHSESNLAQSQGGWVLLYQVVHSKLC